MNATPRVAVIGSTGYSGAEIVHLLLKHPAIELHTLMTANLERKEAKPQPFGEALPQFQKRCDLEIEPLDVGQLEKRGIAAVFLPTPNETSHELVPHLAAKRIKIIDLSGAFRLKDRSLYPQWYGFEHQQTELLAQAVYGLTEWNRAQIRDAALLANPGCYPTSILLPLLPLHQAGLIDPACDIICDSKSGVSGAGKTPSPVTHFSEVTENFKAYNVLKHRHAPEIWQELGTPGLVFTPHLLPLNRGILSTIYARTRPGVSAARIAECLEHAYQGERLIRLFRHGALPEIKHVAHTNYCDIGWKFDPDRKNLILVSAIDNLGKGAAGQAIQNMNVMLGLEETLGLL